MTNIDEVFKMLADQGQYPRINADAYIMLELMGHRLDREVERNFVEARNLSLEGRDITSYIDSHLEISNVLRTTMPHFEAGITPDMQLTYPSLSDLPVKSAMIRAADKVYLLADSSKIGTSSFASLGRLSLIDTLITDSKITPAQLEAIRELKVEVI